MFLRVCGTSAKKKTSPYNVLSEAITQLSSAISPRPVVPTTASGGAFSSPAKIIDCRAVSQKSAELKNLVQLGVLSEEEYCVEKEAIISSLKNIGQ